MWWIERPKQYAYKVKVTGAPVKERKHGGKTLGGKEVS